MEYRDAKVMHLRQILEEIDKRVRIASSKEPLLEFAKVYHNKISTALTHYADSYRAVYLWEMLECVVFTGEKVRGGLNSRSYLSDFNLRIRAVIRDIFKRDGLPVPDFLDR